MLVEENLYHQAQVFKKVEGDFELCAVITAETFGQLFNILVTEKFATAKYSVYFKLIIDNSRTSI